MNNSLLKRISLSIDQRVMSSEYLSMITGLPTMAKALSRGSCGLFLYYCVFLSLRCVVSIIQLHLHYYFSYIWTSSSKRRYLIYKNILRWGIVYSVTFQMMFSDTCTIKKKFIKFKKPNNVGKTLYKKNNTVHFGSKTENWKVICKKTKLWIKQFNNYHMVIWNKCLLSGVIKGTPWLKLTSFQRQK